MTSLEGVRKTDPTNMAQTIEEKKAADNIAVAARASSFFDEKDSMEKETASGVEIGEVYAEGPRLIDLGEDGKERPIGKNLPT